MRHLGLLVTTLHTTSHILRFQFWNFIHAAARVSKQNTQRAEQYSGIVMNRVSVSGELGILSRSNIGMSNTSQGRTSQAIHITKDGGYVAQESVDGRFVYYVGQKKGLWRVPVSGGPETLVFDREVNQDLWDLTDRGFYWVFDNTISFLDFTTGRVRSLARLSNEAGFGLGLGLGVSPDGKWLLYSAGLYNDDIMMIDNFR